MDLTPYIETYDKAKAFVKRLDTVTLKGTLGEYSAVSRRYVVNPPIEDAKMITSRKTGTNRHALILDIDLPVEVWKSSSGNTHILIDASLSRREFNAIMRSLSRGRVVQEYWAKSAMSRKTGASLRLPWIRKHNDDKTITENAKAEEMTLEDLENL